MDVAWWIEPNPSDFGKTVMVLIKILNYFKNL